MPIGRAADTGNNQSHLTGPPSHRGTNTQDTTGYPHCQYASSPGRDSHLDDVMFVTTADKMTDCGLQVGVCNDDASRDRHRVHELLVTPPYPHVLRFDSPLPTAPGFPAYP